MGNRPNEALWRETMLVLLRADSGLTAPDVGAVLQMSPQAAYGRLMRLFDARLVTRSYVNGRVLWVVSAKGRQRYKDDLAAVVREEKDSHPPMTQLPDVVRRRRRMIGL